MQRKIVHLEIIKTGKHHYYGSLTALCNANKKLSYQTLRRIDFKKPWENELYIIRVGRLLTSSDIVSIKNEKNRKKN